MVALLIAVGALFIAVIGCAIIGSGPSDANEGVDQEHERRGWMRA